jgi:uncharacterized CHY-type Zn-finger protein
LGTSRFNVQKILHSASRMYVIICFQCISEQIAVIPVYSIKWFLRTTDRQSVYCVVRNRSLSKRDYVSSLRCKFLGYS